MSILAQALAVLPAIAVALLVLAALADRRESATLNRLLALEAKADERDGGANDDLESSAA